VRSRPSRPRAGGEDRCRSLKASFGLPVSALELPAEKGILISRVIDLIRIGLLQHPGGKSKEPSPAVFTHADIAPTSSFFLIDSAERTTTHDAFVKREPLCKIVTISETGVSFA